MSHAQKADRLLIKPAAGARPAPPCTRGRIIRKARTRAASHPKSHTRHGGHQAGDGPRQTDLPSLTVPRGLARTTNPCRHRAERSPKQLLGIEAEEEAAPVL
jgi:hypothetical protein